jgi:acyl carrier protein
MTHTDTEIMDTIRHILTEVAGIPAEEIQPDRRLVDDLDIDSLTLVEVATAVQDALEVEVPDEQLKDLKTVGDVVALVQAVLSAQRPA